MYGIFTNIYHKNQPSVQVNIPVPWILWDSFTDILVKFSFRPICLLTLCDRKAFYFAQLADVLSPGSFGCHWWQPTRLPGDTCKKLAETAETFSIAKSGAPSAGSLGVFCFGLTRWVDEIYRKILIFMLKQWANLTPQNNWLENQFAFCIIQENLG